MAAALAYTTGMTVPAPDFELLFEQSPDVLLVLLPDAPRFTMVAATRSRLEATHATREQTVGHGLFELFPDNPDDAAASGATNLRASLNRVLETRLPDTMAVQKYDIRGADGTFEVRFWSPRNLPVLSSSGDVLYILHRVEDVTELVKASELGQKLRGRTQEMEREVVRRSLELDAANRQLRDANVKLNELDAAKTEFFNNVSHEFRTPLTLMLGPLKDCLSDAGQPLSATQRGRLQLAYDHSLRLLKLVNALLDFSRLEAGRMHANFAAVDIATATRELAVMFQTAFDKAGVQLNLDCPPLTEAVWIDQSLWEKIIPNLISNAFKFTLQGQVAVRVRETSTHAVIEVSDTGVGIPDSELSRVFERFHRVVGAPGRSYEGAGIGLALVRELVGMHGGTIGVVSALGVGTTFRIEIPKGYAHLPADALHRGVTARPTFGTAEAQAVEAKRWVAGEHTSVEVTSRPTVLVIDDNADLRDYMCGLLAPFYNLSTAADGAAALELIRAHLPDLVLSDVMMPVMNGIELVKALRADNRTQSIPVILLSARAGDQSTVEGLDAGSDDYLTKPFSAQELLARVRSNLQLAQSRREWTAKLETANRELDAFSYSVAHDLRAPLRAVDAFTLMVLEDSATQLDEEGRRRLNVVRSSAQRMAQLIDDLLHLSRVTRIELIRTPLDLSALAGGIVQELRRTDLGHRVGITVQPGLQVSGDRQLLKIALENLLGNAWKFTGKTPDPRVEFGCEQVGGEAVYFIRDNGAGFNMSYAPKLFGVFQRLHSESEFQGTGIGLATVQRIISRHGGRIWAHGEPGVGAVFHFTLGN